MEISLTGSITFGVFAHNFFLKSLLQSPSNLEFRPHELIWKLMCPLKVKDCFIVGGSWEG